MNPPSGPAAASPSHPRSGSFLATLILVTHLVAGIGALGASPTAVPTPTPTLAPRPTHPPQPQPQLQPQLQPETPSRLPAPALNLQLTAPIATWDEAVPLGNGLLGALLWGDGQRLRLSLDRGDLWDERPAPGNPLRSLTYARLAKLAAEGKNSEISRIVDALAYDQKHPTKIPAGRLEFNLAPTQTITRFELDLASAEGRAHLAEGSPLQTIVCAQPSVVLLRIPGPAPTDLTLRAPDSVQQLGYPAARHARDGACQWFLQTAADGLVYCVAVATRPLPQGTLLATTVTSTHDGPDPVVTARSRLTNALDQGYDSLLAPHLDWWRTFWSKSRIELPDLDALRHYYLVQYFYGAASRRGAPPLPLQGVWTADAGTLPPWKGDYHHDLNTQMTYLGYQAAGRWDEGLCFLDFLWDRLPVFRQFAREFFETPGANVPGVMTLAGAPLGGWAQYSLAPVHSGWLAHLFYLHWRYTADDAFLRTRAYPWCAEVGESLAALLQPDAQGRLVLPTSASPEVHDNSQRAWLKPNSNYDLAILRMLFLSLREMAAAQNQSAAADRWNDLATRLGPFHADTDGTLRINEVEPLPESHRHFSNLMNLYPFNLTTQEGSDRDRQLIQASLAQYDRFGTRQWCGYSFTWMSALRARVGDAESALRHLEIYLQAFTLRNGFHANGDQTKSGFSSMTYRPFTLEGNFLATAALHEMLLQSWSAQPGAGDWGSLRLFPAMPWRWADAAFEDLRAEGGHRVSARRHNHATTWLRIVAGRDGALRVRNNFGARTPRWNRSDVRLEGQDYTVHLHPGEVLEANLESPAAPSPQPTNAAPRLNVRRRE
ncbi:MAG: glycoside hydrolase N-terminal domain-containing protein [Verrucomicrobiales bacterium]|nr:glycoside hydrolase N-terminal domain-containing protein [Verrucomicrobiales bacterium]